MKTLQDRKVVTFTGDTTKVKFFSDQTADLRVADKMLTADFEGMGCDPNFDTGTNGFFSYLEKFTSTKESDFSKE